MPTRRPLIGSQMRVRLDDPKRGWGSVEVDGESHTYKLLQRQEAEATEPLLDYLPEEVFRLREFLLEATEWHGESKTIPAYMIGWPGEEQVEVVGIKATLAYLRRWWPLRDHQSEPEQVEQPVVVPIRLSGPAEFAHYLQRMR